MNKLKNTTYIKSLDCKQQIKKFKKPFTYNRKITIYNRKKDRQILKKFS